MIANQSPVPTDKPISYVSDSCGIRTRPSWLERPATSPEVERAILVMYVRTSSAVILKVFLQATHSVDWEVLEPSSPALQASAIPSQLPVHLHVKRWKKARKNPVSLWCNTGFANVCFVSTAECYLRCGCKGSAFAFRNTIQPSYPLNRSVLSRIEVMISYPVIDCFSDSLFRDHIRRVLKI